jgi:capsular polysaccharide biosynthesis protein
MDESVRFDRLRPGFKREIIGRLARFVRNKVDLSREPDALFLNPWQDPGVRLVHAPDFLWRAMPATLIEGFAASESDTQNQKITAFIAQTRQHRKFSQALEYNSVPVVLDHVEFRKSFVFVQDRLWLTGAAAARAQVEYKRRHEGSPEEAEAALVAYFDTCQKVNAGLGLPVLEGPPATDLDFVIECRNTFNYFHFLTESLSQLEVLAALDFKGRIFFHFPNREEKMRGFAQAFVEALYPEYEGRVFFERAPREYPHALAAFDLLGSHYQAPADDVAGVETHSASDHMWKGRTATIGSQSILAMNCVNTNLLGLRKRALRMIEEGDFDHLPARFYVGRDTRQSRTRQMAGEDLLFDHLQLFGFEYVVFESLSPLEQVALMARAEMMISYHGAGFTNMLFANPEAYVIEIGTLQTAVSRWDDFWPLANAAQCKYVTFFADYNTDSPVEDLRPFKDEILPVHLTEQGIAQVLAFVVSLLGHAPEMATKEQLARLVTELMTVGETAQALALLDAHDRMVEWDADLSLLKADCHKALDSPKSELVALDRAYKADPTRWKVLVRIIWCANRCDRPQVIRWALSRLEDQFPDRHRAFVENHEWVRYVA